MVNTSAVLEKFNETVHEANSDEELQVAFTSCRLLFKLLSNIAKNPHTEKFRLIKKENSTLKQKFWPFEPVSSFLTGIGFVEHEEGMHLPMEVENLRDLRQGLLCVSRLVKVLEKKMKKRNKKKTTSKKDKLSKERERAFILAQFRSDQQEKKDERAARGKAKDSVPVELLKSGNNTKTFRDVGIDLNKKGG
eukprot:g5525.t1